MERRIRVLRGQQTPRKGRIGAMVFEDPQSRNHLPILDLVRVIDDGASWSAAEHEGLSW